MRPTPDAGTDWYRAVPLVERIAAGAAPAAAAAATPRAREQLAQWRAQAPFADDARFAERLAAAGLDQAAFAALLGEDDAALARRLPQAPAWLQKIAAAFAAEAPPGGGSDHPGSFLDLVAPLLRHELHALRDGVDALAGRGGPLPFDPATVLEVLLPSLAQPLLEMLSRTLVLELHCARLMGVLAGDDAEQRFQSFLQRLRQRDVALAILREYPVLARQLVLRAEQWVACSLELLAHLCDDALLLDATFADGEDLGALCRVEGEAGDRHRGGRAVLLLTFASGRRLVYKPRSTAAEARLQELIAWTNARGARPALRTLGVLDRGDHGWVEFVAAGPCRDEAALARFFERQGSLLAILHVLAATDAHSENLIAAGEHPVLVDAEALFHRRLPQPRKDPASEGLSDSVVAVRLLPQLSYVEGVAAAIDLSGMGGAAGQPSPFATPTWQGLGTDEARLVARRAPLPGAQNLPTLRGAAVDVLAHRQPLAAGFAATYALLLRHREALLAADGPLAAFDAVETRVIARPTQVYNILLQQSLHPDRLRDALARELHFDRLWLRVQDFPCLRRLIAAETADLDRGDIPIFTTRPGSRDVLTSQGERIAGFFARTGTDIVRERVRRLGSDDLERQLWLIDASFGMLRDSQGRAAATADRPPRRRRAARRADAIAAVCAIADRISALAWHADGAVGWVGPHPSGQCGWSLGPLRPDLGEGLAGIALFLAYAARVSGARRHQALAEAAVAALQRQLRERACDDVAGIRHVLATLGALWHRPALAQLACTLGVDTVAVEAPAFDAAVMTTAPDDSLGGGEMRRIEHLEALGRRDDRADLLAAAATASAALVDRVLAGTVRCAGPGGTATPGVRSGLAGIGYGLLRRALPALPSLLPLVPRLDRACPAPRNEPCDASA